MFTIGLTGGIGSGKTIVGKGFKLLGIPVYDSDLEAKRLMGSNQEIKEKLAREFGDDIYDSDLQLNRKGLADIIFKNPENLQIVNSIVHPVVRQDFKEWCRQNASKPYVVQESAIFFETGLYKNFDKIITVTADQEIRIQRVVKRDSSSRGLVEERMQNQLSEQIKIEKSDFVIYNNSELILPQILKIDQTLRNLANTKKDAC